MRYLRKGFGRPLLLIHGLGGSHQSWEPILKSLTQDREVFAIDLPGFGNTPPLKGRTTVATLADAVTDFLTEHHLLGTDVVGSSLGGRIALELARRRDSVGGVVALSPGGFWEGWEQLAFYSSLALSIRIVRGLKPLIPYITDTATGRTLLFSQFSAHPRELRPKFVRSELQNFALSPAFDETLREYAFGEIPKGIPAGAVEKPIVIGWGRQDRVCFPAQAKRAKHLFPDARIHWFENCGHFPQWDAPAFTSKLILDTLGRKILHTVKKRVA
jgi:pimeloyl-ACP methyl ester carboxylesterase